MTITVDGPLPGPFRWSIVVSEHRDGFALDDALTHALREIDDHENADDRIQLWIRHVDDEADAEPSEPDPDFDAELEDESLDEPEVDDSLEEPEVDDEPALDDFEEPPRESFL